MNRIVPILYCLGMIIACLYVPWKWDMATIAAFSPSITLEPAGYMPLWSLNRGLKVLDIEKFILEILILTAIAVVGWLVTQKRQ